MDTQSDSLSNTDGSVSVYQAGDLTNIHYADIQNESGDFYTIGPYASKREAIHKANFHARRIGNEELIGAD